MARMSGFPGDVPGGFDPRAFSGIPLFRELERLLSWSGGPVNWEIARQVAESAVAQQRRDDALPVVAGTSGRDDSELASAVGAAELWLDAVTALPAVEGPVRAYDPGAWIAAACSSEGLGRYVEPVAEGMAAALAKGLPPEVSGLLGGTGAVGGPLASMGAMLYGMQVGQVAGALAGQLLGTYDLGVPTVGVRAVGLVGDAARREAATLGVDVTELRWWLALREAAHRRQFAGVPWLDAHLAGLLRRFAESADLDPMGLMGGLMGGSGLAGLDPTALGDPERMRELMADVAASAAEPTPAQREVNARLQALVAFTEGWVDTVVRAAAGGRLPSLAALEEAARRRRGERGPGEQALSSLLALDLRPADRRTGEAFCRTVIAARGQAGLDRAWRGPEWLPSPAELEDPSRWLVRLAADEGAADDLAPLGAELEIPDDLSGLDDPGSPA